jgi:serine/threonine protein kinase/tetratricopeptide (TPR) repeat protein
MADPTMKGLSPERSVLPRGFGGYGLLRRIAGGARGEVFAALRPVEIERFCALKILTEAASRRPELVRALRDEAALVVRRIHGNLVQIYDVGLVDEKLFFVSELVEGMDLLTVARRLRERGKSFPVDVAVFIAMEVAAALGAVRRADGRRAAGAPAAAAPLTLTLPARSILISTEGEVKLVHYGAAMAALGTRDEIGLPDGIGPVAGAAADAALVGRLLVTLVGSTAPPLLARIIERAVSPDPAQRLADADDIRTALGSILRTLRGPKAAAAQSAAGELVRGAAAKDDVVDRASLATVAKSYDPKRGASPPTWKAITLSRLVATGMRPTIAPAPPGAAPADLAVGQVIPGTRYRVLSTVGEGGMGTVYAAEHIDLEKKVALKLLRADVAADAETLQWFRQEARAASKVGSDYICDVTDFGELADGRVFFVMEYLDGQSLGRVLREVSELPPARAIAILRQVAKALGAAHDKGIVHLDVKPDNVMLLPRGSREDAVKVVDFGIAGLVQAQGNREDVFAGTPEYVSPERASGRAYDHRSDVYSLGVMAYEMLAGAVPFHGKNVGATLVMQVKDPPQPLGRHPAAKDVPAELAALVMRMLEKDPAARPANMAEVEALLCEAQIAAGIITAWDDLELPAVDEEWRGRLARRMPSRHRPRRAVALVAGAVAVASLAVAGYLGLIRKPQVVVREVRVDVTKTEEAPEVAAALVKAAEAARGERYVRPDGDSALSYIRLGEAEATRLRRVSPGAAMLRRLYASALTLIGNELTKADLTDLAVAKYKEALLFQPDDAELRKKAELASEERRPREKRAGVGMGTAAPAPAAGGDEAKDAAARVFLAATHGRLSEARLALAALARLDAAGTQQARLADALRTRALATWSAEKKDEARPLYALVAELDASDSQARERAREPPPPPPPAPVPVAAALPAPPPTPIPPATKPRRHDEGAALDPDAPRDPAASRAAAEAGTSALARGRLADAESAFTRAVRADAQNAVAVGGLAAVAFERARYSDAMDFARRASRLAPKNPKYLVLTGDAYFKLLRYDDALRSYDKARALAPSDEEVASRLERVRAKVGNK